MSRPIDVVYTWVNHEDPDWAAMHKEASASAGHDSQTHESVDNLARFQNRNEIVYSIGSIRRFAPWVRNIFIVTNCAVPPALANDEQITVVSHESVFPDPAVLPCFNSRAIEANLHRIPGIAEQILYFNDDFFLCAPVSPEDFFSAQGQVRVFPSRHPIPYGVTTGLRPIDYGALNACELLIDDFEYRPQYKLHHSPYPLLKSNLEALESKYPERFCSTRSHKFRDNSDIPPATTLQAYYAVATGTGVMSDIRSRYVDIGDPLFVLLIHPWSPLRRGKYQTLCLNEVTQPRFFAATRDAIVRKFLEDMFGE